MARKRMDYRALLDKHLEEECGDLLREMVKDGNRGPPLAVRRCASLRPTCGGLRLLHAEDL